MQATDGVVSPLRERASELMAGEATVDEWEIAVMHREHDAQEGSWCRVTWLRCEPSEMESTIDFFRDSVLGRMEGTDGFCSASFMVNRMTGECCGTTRSTPGRTWRPPARWPAGSVTSAAAWAACSSSMSMSASWRSLTCECPSWSEGETLRRRSGGGAASQPMVCGCASARPWNARMAGFWIRPSWISMARLIVSLAAHASGPDSTVSTNGISASLFSHVAEFQR